MSRHTFTRQVTRIADSAFPAAVRGREVVLLTDREKYLYESLPDNISHIVREGDTLQNLAARYYAPLSDPPKFSAASLWWAIADFQPQPIHDPTILLAVGSTLIVPSLRTINDRVFNPNIRREQGGFR
jgi:hypothetical protein